MIHHLPNWARPQVQAYLASGQLEGAQRQPLNPDQAQQALQGSQERFERSRSCDETPADYAPGQAGKTCTPGILGAETTYFCEQDGKRTLVRHLDNAQLAIYSQDDGQVLRDIAITRADGMETISVGQVDRQNPDNSFLLYRGF